MKRIALYSMMTVLLMAGCAKAPVETKKDQEAKQMIAAGTAYLKQADAVKAVQSFAAAIKASPDLFDGYYLLSETLIHVQQYAQAEGVLLAAVKRFPDNGLGYYLLSIAQDGAGNLLPAIMAARKSVDLFSAKGDKEGVQRATIVLAALLNKGKQLSEQQAIANAAKDAAQAVEAKAGAAVDAAAAVVPAKMQGN